MHIYCLRYLIRDKEMCQHDSSDSNVWNYKVLVAHCLENSVKNFPFLVFDCGHIDFYFFKFRQPLNFGTYLLLRVWLWRRSSSVGKRKFLRIHLSAGFMPSCTIFKDFQQARLESLLSRFWSPGLMFDTPGVNDFPACITDVSI